MELKELEQHWEAFAATDPLWAILTLPGTRNGKWNVRDFFQTGEEEIASILEYAGSLGREIPTKRALDFGCGVGRLTQALCGHFDEAVGVDIADSMIRLAERYNRHGSRCRYLVNKSDDLALFENGSFDFIYSNIVLQHMQPEYSKSYIRDFIRVLTPAGMAVFQLPSGLKPIESRVAPRRSAILEPLPASGFRAEIAPVDLPTTVAAGGPFTFRVWVRNRGDVVWPALGAPDRHFQIELGAHWCTPAGEPVALDVARAVLPHDLAPGEAARLEIAITAPHAPGSHLLELDLVQQGIAWFKDRGSPAVRLDVDVLARDRRVLAAFGRILHPLRARAFGARSLTPRMEMHAIPRSEVLSWVRQCGGEVVDTRENGWAGEEWLSYFYCVQRADPA
jgi:SAM-dependent methyltransferase